MRLANSCLKHLDRDELPFLDQWEAVYFLSRRLTVYTQSKPEQGNNPRTVNNEKRRPASAR